METSIKSEIFEHVDLIEQVAEGELCVAQAACLNYYSSFQNNLLLVQSQHLCIYHSPGVLIS